MRYDILINISVVHVYLYNDILKIYTHRDWLKAVGFHVIISHRIRHPIGICRNENS